VSSLHFRLFYTEQTLHRSQGVDPFDHLSEVRVVHGRQSEMMTSLTTGNTGGYNGIDSMNEVPLVFE
jgi:hypothetical protein